MRFKHTQSADRVRFSLKWGFPPTDPWLVRVPGDPEVTTHLQPDPPRPGDHPLLMVQTTPRYWPQCPDPGHSQSASQLLKACPKQNHKEQSLLCSGSRAALQQGSTARHEGAEGPQIDVLRGWLPGENLGAGTFPPMASTCLSFLIMIPLELAHSSNNDITATLSNCAPTCARQELDATSKPTGEGPGKQHKSGGRSCQDPGSTLTLGGHLPAPGLSLLICKMGVTGSDYVTLTSQESLPVPSPHVTRLPGYGVTVPSTTKTPNHHLCSLHHPGDPSPSTVLHSQGGGTGRGSHALSPWDSSPPPASTPQPPPHLPLLSAPLLFSSPCTIKPELSTEVSRSYPGELQLPRGNTRNLSIRPHCS